jgi:DNA-binding PadR family transcriptional regulator
MICFGVIDPMVERRDTFAQAQHLVRARATRCHVASTTRLLVLGVVRIFQPVHGYDVRRELVGWHAEEWASVAPGSIYNALKSLAREGLLEVVGTDTVGNRPERTTYKLTPRGETEFRELLRETWWTVQPPPDPMVAAVSLMGFMGRDEAIAALEARIVHIREQLVHGEYAIKSVDEKHTPGHVREMMRLISARMAAEIEWAKAFLARLRAGEYVTVDDPPWEPAMPQSPREYALVKRPKKKAKTKPRKRRA